MRPEPDNSIVGARFKNLREGKGIKAAWVAHRLGILRSTLSMLESGKRRWTPKLIKQYREIIEE